MKCILIVYYEYFDFLRILNITKNLIFLTKNRINDVNASSIMYSIINSIEDHIYDFVQPINFTDS